VADLAADAGVRILLRDRADDEDLVSRAEGSGARPRRGHQLTDVDPTAHLRTSPLRDPQRPRLAADGVHRLRPLNWAIINGEKEVGVTAHMMDDDLDAGDIVLQRAAPVGPRDTATDLAASRSREGGIEEFDESLPSRAFSASSSVVSCSTVNRSSSTSDPSRAFFARSSALCASSSAMRRCSAVTVARNTKRAREVKHLDPPFDL
jgi:hypothetical protein